MLDTEGEVRKFDPEWRRETGTQLGLAFGCQGPAPVDEVYAHLIEAGFHGTKSPEEPSGASATGRFAILRGFPLLR